MKRRVEIARALIGSPKVLFLDEPTRGLALPAKLDMWNLLKRLAAEDNVTTFLSSHDAQELRCLCGEISVIASGRVVYTGATRELGADLDTFEERLIELLSQRHWRESFLESGTFDAESASTKSIPRDGIPSAQCRLCAGEP
jgi:ABC-type multidrug transport system ATPase subunit